MGKSPDFIFIIWKVSNNFAPLIIVTVNFICQFGKAIIPSCAIKYVKKVAGYRSRSLELQEDLELKIQIRNVPLKTM